MTVLGVTVTFDVIAIAGYLFGVFGSGASLSRLLTAAGKP